MKKIIVGTTNEAKIKMMRSALASLPIHVEGPPKNAILPYVSENEDTAQKNAKSKAITYAKALHESVISVDNGLYLDGLEPDKQPGLHIRRIPGSTERPTDEVALAYYSNLIKSLGGKVHGHFEYGICISDENGVTHETTINSPCTLVEKPGKTMTPGYPISSLKIDPDNGKYLSDMSQEEQDAFWQKTIGQKIRDFMIHVGFSDM